MCIKTEAKILKSMPLQLNQTQLKEGFNKTTFSFTSSWASTYSPRSTLFLSPLLTSDGRSHASLIDLIPKNSRRVTAAYSPIGKAVQRNTI